MYESYFRLAQNSNEMAFSRTPETRQPLNTNWNNGSHSSILTTSDTATFHSAHAHTSHMELMSLSQPFSSAQKAPLSPQIDAIKMSRQDSGYSDTTLLENTQPRTVPSRGTSVSTSSTRRNSPSKSKRRSNNNSISSSRPTTKRARRSAPQTSQLPASSSRRPSLQSHRTTPYLSTIPSNQFFQFPSLTPEPESPPESKVPPPTTIQYWTSDSTRRLEYAAIDAASRGVRGFLIKLVPDCILPKEKRRTKFCEGNEGSEAGSVRRYRLDLPEEKGVECSIEECRRGLLKRWTSFGKS